MDDIQRCATAAVPRPGPTYITDPQLLGDPQNGFRIDELALMIRAKLANDDRQVVAAHKVADITAYGVVVLIHLVHMNTEQGVIQNIGIRHLGRIVQHVLFPVLPPTGRIYHQCVGQAGIA